MALLVSRQTQRLNLPADLPGVSDGDWVEIVSTYNSDMRRRIMRRTMNINMATDKDRPSMDMDVFGGRQAILEEIIAGWSEPVPVTPENIGLMHPDIQDWIATEFDKIVAGRSEEEKKDSSDNSSDTSLIHAPSDSPQNSDT